MNVLFNFAKINRHPLTGTHYNSLNQGAAVAEAPADNSPGSMNCNGPFTEVALAQKTLISGKFPYGF